MSQPDVPDLESLPYAIRAYVEARDANDRLIFDAAERERLEIDSVSRDERDWHHPGERGEAITRIRWRHQAAKDIKDLAQTCVEAEVARLAEKLLPVCLTGIHGGSPPLWAAKRAFSEAEEFIAERAARANAIRSSNVDGLLD